ncbi:hypothetical protein PQX77_014777 [Marasmius sp. AFHP31]|nr:hypothetical protein PQX77_014777 [Marasmius sp. AFHP31]
MSLPSLKSSWSHDKRREIQEIIPGLLLGSVYSATNVDYLKAAGVTNLVRIFDSREAQAMNNFVAHRKKSPAAGLEDFKQDFVEVNVKKAKGFMRVFSSFESVLPSADACNSGTKKTLVYCTTGMAVSPPFVVMLLVKRLAWDPVYAMEYVCDRRACVYFTGPAQKAIMKFATCLKFQAELKANEKASSSGLLDGSKKRKREDSDDGGNEQAMDTEESES